MERLNYQHLYYFWTVAKEGSISRACEKLQLAQPTISGQLAARERFYAISPQRKLKHPAVLAILESARAGLFDVPEVRGKA